MITYTLWLALLLMNKKTGFTLLELLTGIAMTLGIAGVLFPFAYNQLCIISSYTKVRTTLLQLMHAHHYIVRSIRNGPGSLQAWQIDQELRWQDATNWYALGIENNTLYLYTGDYNTHTSSWRHRKKHIVAHSIRLASFNLELHKDKEWGISYKIITISGITINGYAHPRKCRYV